MDYKMPENKSDLRSDAFRFPFSKLLKMFISQQYNTEKSSKSWSWNQRVGGTLQAQLVIQIDADWFSYND